MGQVINLLIVLGSLGGIIFILYRKIPLLLALPQEQVKMGNFIKEGIQKITSSQTFKPEKIIDTTLSKARTLVSKTETQTTQWLEKLRKKSDQHKEKFSESYWDRLRKKKR